PYGCYCSGQSGRSLTPTPDAYTVPRRPLKVHQHVTYKTKIAKLPATATSLAFKSIVTYGNGDADRWIEIPVEGQAEPPHPAPVLKLQPAAVTPSSAPPTSAAPSAVPTSAAATTAAAAGKGGGGSSALWWVLA